MKVWSGVRTVAAAAVLLAALEATSGLGAARRLAEPQGEPEPAEAVTRDARAAWERANRLYQLDDMEEAERLYGRVLAAYPNSVAARYNLGNALFRQGRAGAALGEYLGALRRAPRDSAARANATAARAVLASPLPAEDRDVIAGPAGPPAAWLSVGEATWLGAAVLYLASGLVALALIAPRARGVAAGGATVIFLAAAVLACLFTWSRLTAPDALVVAHGAHARAAPAASGAAVVTLPEGAAVRLGDERDGWAFVSLPNGLSGWVARSDVGRIP